MSPEEMRTLIETTIREYNFWNALIIAIVPVILTIIINTLYDILRRKSESRKQYNLEQLTKLYLPLYSMISQSEYIRYFYEMKQPFEEIPFSEIHVTTKNANVDSVTGIFNITEVEVDDDITKVNKKNIDKLIIDNAKYASIELIKLAVAHRYLESNYLSDKMEEPLSEKFKDKELVILANLIKLIVKETNEKLKYCNMEYDKFEIENGTMNTKIY